jgi:hypothetical protein
VVTVVSGLGTPVDTYQSEVADVLDNLVGQAVDHCVFNLFDWSAASVCIVSHRVLFVSPIGAGGEDRMDGTSIQTRTRRIRTEPNRSKAIKTGVSIYIYIYIYIYTYIYVCIYIYIYIYIKPSVGSELESVMCFCVCRPGQEEARMFLVPVRRAVFSNRTVVFHCHTGRALAPVISA